MTVLKKKHSKRSSKHIKYRWHRPSYHKLFGHKLIILMRHG